MVGRRGAYPGVRHENDDFLLGGGGGLVIKSSFGGRGTQLLL